MQTLPHPPFPPALDAPWPVAPNATPPRPAVPQAAVEAWLDECERDLVHPSAVAAQLRRAGWHPFDVARAVDDYRRRFNEHDLAYAALLVSTGLTALAAGTVGHLLVHGVDHAVNREAVAMWLTVFLCALPFAAWSHLWAARADREDPVAAWSTSRQTLARTLLWACGIVGVGRLLIYVGQLIHTLVVSTDPTGASIAAGALNVVITISIALPLGIWSFRFLHRFDAEDPDAPAPERRRRPE